VNGERGGLNGMGVWHALADFAWVILSLTGVQFPPYPGYRTSENYLSGYGVNQDLARKLFLFVDLPSGTT
jgi:hypothetical protein